VRLERGIETEVSQRLGGLEIAIRVVPSEEQFGRPVHECDSIDVILLADDHEGADEDVRAERRARCQGVAGQPVQRHDHEEREHGDDDERPDVVRRDDAGCGHQVVPLGNTRDARHPQQTEPDAADPLLDIDRRTVHEHGNEEEEREDRGDRDATRVFAEGRIGSEESDRGRPQRERGDGQRPIELRRDEVGKRGCADVQSHA